jgi:hypothetical protein
MILAIFRYPARSKTENLVQMASLHLRALFQTMARSTGPAAGCESDWRRDLNHLRYSTHDIRRS